MAIFSSDEDIKRILRQGNTIAVLGAHKIESKAAHYVPKYLAANGYDVYPVNPQFAGERLFAKEITKTLESLTTAIDIVNVFRRSEHLEAHLDDILAMRPLPKVVWFQLGIFNHEVARKLSEAGIDVIQDRCMLADHQYLLKNH